MQTKVTLLFILLFLVSASADCQYCDVNTATSYSADMPGIANFKLNTIDRTSAPLECTHPCTSYVNTGLSTRLEKGKTYSFSLAHTRDMVVFPDARNNIRIWIDLNHNDKLDDAGETLASLDFQKTADVSTGTITIPSSAMTGSTKMRVTAKMSSDAGHTAPTPCDMPADPLGYHGEVEDYTVNITWPASVSEVSNELNVSAYPNPFTGNTTISYDVLEAGPVTIEIYNILGEMIGAPVKSLHTVRGSHRYPVVMESAGVYFVKVTTGRISSVTRVQSLN